MLKLVLFAIVVAAGQLLFKRVAMRLGETAGPVGLLRQVMFDPWFILAMTLYIGATLLWIAALRDIPLSRAYPFTALAFALVPMGAAIFFGETLGIRYYLGLSMLLAGILLISSNVNARPPIHLERNHGDY